mgnify:CR=1 FL=1
MESMHKVNFDGERLSLEYPCPWTYKLIGADEARLREIIDAVASGRAYTVKISNRSSGGRYCCLDMEMVVMDEGERTATYAALSSSDGVRMVL